MFKGKYNIDILKLKKNLIVFIFKSLGNVRPGIWQFRACLF